MKIKEAIAGLKKDMIYPIYLLKGNDHFLQNFFIEKLSEEYLLYGSELKLFTIILLVVITILIYVLISLLTKTFKYSDIKLKY